MTADVIDLNRHLNMKAHGPMKARTVALDVEAAWQDFSAAHKAFLACPSASRAALRAVAAYNRWAVVVCQTNVAAVTDMLCDLIDDDPGMA